MNRSIAFFMWLAMSTPAFAGEKIWVEIKAFDAYEKESSAVSYFGKVDIEDIQEITVGSAARAFVLINNLAFVEPDGTVKNMNKRVWAGPLRVNGSVYIRTSSIISIVPIDKGQSELFERAVAR